MRTSRWWTFGALFVLVAGSMVTTACQPRGEEPAEEEMAVEEVEAPAEMTAEQTDATAAGVVLSTADGTEVGTVTFTETADGVQMVAELHGIEGAGMHGIHVHEAGECSAPDFKSAGGHFNPEGTDHACPPALPRHAGDFGNIETGEDGTGILTLTSDLVTVAPGPTSVVGKAVILHAGADDCASQPSGAAGARLACGVVTAAETMDLGPMDETMEGEGAEADSGMGE